MKLLKLLQVIFVFLLLITVIEGGYYLYYTQLQHSNTKELVAKTPDKKSASTKFKLAMSPAFWQSFQKIVYSPSATYRFTIDINTEILDIKKKGETIDGVFYPIAMRITADEVPGGSYWMYYSKDQILKTSFKRAVQGTTKQISYNELRIGNKVSIIKIYDPSMENKQSSNALNDFIESTVTVKE